MTTAVTDLSEQKKVLERRAYCSENLRMISTDLSDESTPPAAQEEKGSNCEIGGLDLGDLVLTGQTLSSDGESAESSSGGRDGAKKRASDGGGGEGRGHGRRSGGRCVEREGLGVSFGGDIDKMPPAAQGRESKSHWKSFFWLPHDHWPLGTGLEQLFFFLRISGLVQLKTEDRPLGLSLELREWAGLNWAMRIILGFLRSLG